MSGFAQVESLISNISAATTSDGVFVAVRRHIEALGFEYFTYDLMYSPQTLAPLHFTSFPYKWVDHYISKRYARFDMMSRYTAQTIRPFPWIEVSRKIELTTAQKLVRSEGTEHGLTSGGMVPIHGPGPTKAYFAVANSMVTGEFEKIFSTHRHELQLVATYTHERILELGAKTASNARIRLTPREIEVMTWIALGKSNWDVGVILNISETTVKAHLENVCSKLNVRGKTHATAVTIANGYISL